MITNRLLALTFGMTAVVSGQSALQKAQVDLANAESAYQDLEAKNSLEESQLIREVTALDKQVYDLNKEYSRLNKEEQLRTRKKAQLDNLLEKREIEFDYNKGVFDRYLRESPNKFQAAEVQELKAKYDNYRSEIVAAGDDVAKRIEVSLPMVEEGIERVLKLAGGAQFSGKAQSADSRVIEGDFVVVGPMGFFSAKDGSLSGATDKLSGAVEFPAILASEGSTVNEFVKSGKGVIAVDGSLGKAYKLEKATKGLKDYIDGGGYVGYAIVGLGLFSILVALFKFVEINLFHVPNRKMINKFLDVKLSGDVEGAQAIANKIPGLSGKMVVTGEKYFHSKRRILEDALYEKFTAIPPFLERGLPFLSLVAASAPMLGLLGTVLGIMKTFALMSEGGSSDIKVISGGISEALITTFMGLVVAIPVLLLHGFLKGMAKGKAGDAEGVAMSIINGTSEIGQVPQKDDPEEEIEDLVPAA